MSSSGIRMPAVAGGFYDLNPELLTKSVNKYISAAEPKLEYKKIYGLVSPHAGYIYSGKAAGYGYKLISKEKYDTILIISPSHQKAFNGVSIYDGTAYQTPLGNVYVDNELREAIAKHNKFITVSNIGHNYEHALEVQLPFLQCIYKNFKIIPMIMGDQSEEIIMFLADILSNELKDKNVLMIASSDLSHYHSSAVAETLDKQIENHINNFDYSSLLDDLYYNKVEACGGGPIAAIMVASKKLGASKSKVLFRNNSGEVNNDRSQVVGYLSAVMYD